MPQHAPAADAARRPRRALTALEEWHDARPRASIATARGWWWGAFVVASFVWMSNPTVFLVTYYTALTDARDWALVVMVVSLPFLRLPRIPWPWVLFLVLGVLSRFWTINDLHTYITNTVYLQISAIAVIVASNCGPRLVCWCMGLGGVAVGVLSIHAYRLEVPGASYGGVNGAGEGVTVFAGIGTSENILAYTIVLALAATLALGLPERRGARAAWLAVLAFEATILWLAGSGTGYFTALAVALTALLALVWSRTGRERHRLLLAATGALAVAAVLTVVVVTTLLGKELSTFSGRVPFWKATIEVSLETAPWFGSGFGAVWEHPWDPTPPNDLALEIYERAGFPLPHGHNFFVDVLPELGLVGILVALAMVAYAVREVRRCGVGARSSDPVTGRLILFVLVALLVSGITEPMLTVPIGWWSFILVVALPRQGLRFNRWPALRSRGARSRGRRVAT